MINTRFAPSPTGFMHIGNIRVALLSWIFAKHFKGNFYLRIEDTDIKRRKKKFIKNIINILKKLNLNFNKKIYIQTNYIRYYQKIIKNLIKKNKVYYYFKKKKIYKKKKYKKKYYNFCKFNFKKKKKIVVKFYNLYKGYNSWKDLIKGKITILNKELNDFILLKSNGIPTYNFCVVIDDINMKISHIIRGEDHIINTSKQINIYKCLKKKIPKFAHLPIILDIYGKKISKRINKINILFFLKHGFLSKSIIYYLLKISYKKYNFYKLCLKKIINKFNIKNILKSSIKFNLIKLIKINNFYIKKSNIFFLIKKIYYFLKKKYIFNLIYVKKIINLFKNRSNSIEDIKKKINIFLKPKIFNKFYIKYKNILLKKNFLFTIKNIYKKIINYKWNKKNIFYIFNKYINYYKKNISIYYKIIRYIIIGKYNFPNIFLILKIFNKNFIFLNFKEIINN